MREDVGLWSWLIGKKGVPVAESLRRKSRSLPQFERLEGRILLDADPLGSVLPGADYHTDDSAPGGAVIELEVQPNCPTVRPSDCPTVPDELVIVDGALELQFDSKTVIQSDSATIQRSNGSTAVEDLIYLDSAYDGIEQIADILTQYHDLNAIHIISHGAPGQVYLGTGVLNQSTLDDYTDDLETWGDSLAVDGDILLYGCSIGGGSDGLGLMKGIAESTKADVAASNNLTGANELGGDWDLEVATDRIEALLPGEAATLESFEGTLGMIINEFLADPPAGAVGDANGDGIRDAADDEFVELVNDSIYAVDISSWTMKDSSEITHTFPAGTVVPANGAIVIFGGGTPTGSFGGAQVQTASEGSLSLDDSNDSNDSIKLYNGGYPVATLAYGPAANTDQSLTRDPDVSGSFTEHSTATSSGGALFSPGTKIDGSLFLTSDFGFGETGLTRDESNNLVITDINGGDSNDTLTIRSDVAHHQFLISDPNVVLTADITGAVGEGTHTVTIPFGSVNGDYIIANTEGGDDSLAVDFSSGNFSKTILYNGGQPTSGIGDSLTFVGTYDSTTYNFINKSDGSVVVDLDASVVGDEMTVFYTGLEPISSTVTATDVVLNYGNAAETITVSAGPAGQTTVASTAGETTTFNNPSGSLTINAGDGNDIINIDGLDSQFGADLFIDGQADTDTINVNGQIAQAALVTANGNVVLTADAIHVNAGGGIDTTLGSSAHVTLRSQGDIHINASVRNASVTGGDINLIAGWDGTTGLDTPFDMATFLDADVNRTEIYGQGNGSVFIGDGNQTTGISGGSRNGNTYVFGYDLSLQCSNTT
ncbi:DUF4347 domain-containing protein, partial [Planctomycetota bacterium]